MRDQRGHTKIHTIAIVALLTMDVNFAYWPLLHLLSSSNAYLKDDV